jgi:hypothetical protein
VTTGRGPGCSTAPPRFDVPALDGRPEAEEVIGWRTRHFSLSQRCGRAPNGGGSPGSQSPGRPHVGALSASWPAWAEAPGRPAPVEPVQVDVGQQRRYDSALGRSGVAAPETAPSCMTPARSIARRSLRSTIVSSTAAINRSCGISSKLAELLEQNRKARELFAAVGCTRVLFGICVRHQGDDPCDSPTALQGHPTNT